MGKGRPLRGGKPGGCRWRPDRRTGWVRSALPELLGPQPPAGQPGDPPPAPPHYPPPAETGPHPPGLPPCEPGTLHRVELGYWPSPPLPLSPRLQTFPARAEWEAAAGMLPHKESENMFGVGELEDSGTGDEE